MKKIIRISRLAAVALICAVTALLAACSGGSTVEKIPSADKAQASITVAKNELTLDEAIDAALADAVLSAKTPYSQRRSSTPTIRRTTKLSSP